jgi:hypothetical protein
LSASRRIDLILVKVNGSDEVPTAARGKFSLSQGGNSAAQLELPGQERFRVDLIYRGKIRLK